LKNILSVIFFQFVASLALAAPPITHVQCVGLSADQAKMAFPTFYNSVVLEGKKWVAANIDFTMENFRQVEPGNRDLWFNILKIKPIKVEANNSFRVRFFNGVVNAFHNFCKILTKLKKIFF